MAVGRFTGPYRWLSNFYECQIDVDGILYPTVEHAFQAHKTLDPELRYKIALLGPPSAAKSAGRNLTLRPDWEEVKIDVMRDLLRQKFSQRFFGKLLLQTGDSHLEEGNYWGDRFWGTCGGTGENNLGKLIMEIREELR